MGLLKKFFILIVDFLRPLKLVLKQYPFIYPSNIIFNIEEYIKRVNYSTGWYLLREGSWYETRFNNEIQANKLPQNFKEKDIFPFRFNRIVKTYDSFVVQLKKVFVYGDAGIVLTEKNEIFGEFVHNFNISSLQKSYIFKPFYSFSFSIKKNIKMAALLCSPECTNYYHWLFDVLPRLLLLENFLDAIEIFIVPTCINETQIKILSVFGIENERIYKIAPNEKTWFENIYLPSLPGSEGCVPTWSINFIRNKFLINLPRVTKKNIYFTRKDVQSRRIVNEEEIIKILLKNGFEIITMSALGFSEQVEICSQAKNIVSYHGAALSNIVFASNCNILEIFSPDYFRTDCYQTLASQLGFNYWYFLGDNKT